ncbi:hypothetical protein L9F63_003022, partial [Diploptera punctata]
WLNTSSPSSSAYATLYHKMKIVMNALVQSDKRTRRDGNHESSSQQRQPDKRKRIQYMQPPSTRSSVALLEIFGHIPKHSQWNIYIPLREYGAFKKSTQRQNKNSEKNATV